jgi:hypothetical protein
MQSSMMGFGLYAAAGLGNNIPKMPGLGLMPW